MPKPAPIQEFTPTGVVSLDDLLSGVQEPSQNQPAASPAPPAPVPPAPEPSPAPSPEPQEPGDLSTFKPDNDHLDDRNKPTKPAKRDNEAMRTQLQKLAKEKSDYEAKLAEIQKEKDAEAQRIQELQAKYDAIQHERDELSVKASQRDPMQHPDIKKLTEPWNAKVPTLVTQLRESGLKVKNLDGFLSERVGEYLTAGDPDSEEFVDKMEHIRDQVDQFTSGIRRDSDRAAAQDRLMTMIREGASVGHAVRSAVREMQQNAPLFHYREQLAVYENEAREYENVERDLFNPTEDLRMGDPLHQKCILRAMIDGSEEVKKAAQNAKLFSKIISLPAKPLNPQELSQIEPEKQNEAVITHFNRHNEAKRRAVKLIPEALVAYAVLPALWRELETLRKQVKGERDMPKPNSHASNTSEELEGAASITEFQPVGVDPRTLPL